MKNQFIPYEHAKMMKELGFDEDCEYSYNEDGEEKINDMYHSPINNTELEKQYKEYGWDSKEISRPLYQQCEEWLWEKHKILIKVSNEWSRFGASILINKELICATDKYDSPIIAHREGILKAIEYLHKQQP